MVWIAVNQLHHVMPSSIPEEKNIESAKFQVIKKEDQNMRNNDKKQ